MSITPEELLSHLIQINTSNPPGNEMAVALYLKKLFDAEGIPNEIIEPEPGRGNIIARVGSGPRKLLYVAHSDVVPAEDDWDFPPFSGEIKEGMVYGRGALDCKDLMAAQVCAALALAREGSLKGELIIAATGDEERGGNLGLGYIAKHFPEKLQADFAVNEGAMFPVVVKGKPVFFFQVGEKGTAWSRMQTKGISCHGSVPTLGENAVVKMARAIKILGAYEGEIRLIPEVKMLLVELARILDLDVDPDCEQKPNGVDALLDSLNLDKALVETLRAMTRMTVSPNMVQGGLKTNIVPDRCEAELDIRILPGQDKEYVLAQLRTGLEPEVELEIVEYREPTFSTSQSDFYQLMASVTRELAGKDALCLPHISTGSTDSKYLRGMGVPSYGIGHMALGYDPQAFLTIHGRNERTDVASLQLKTDFLTQLARKYLG